MNTSSTPAIIAESATFIGIAYHKRYSICHVIDAAGNDIAKGNGVRVQLLDRTKWT